MEKQILLLKKYGVKNYTIENDKIKINGNLYLDSLKTVDPNFLKNTIINGSLYLNKLKTVDLSFLKDTTINGNLSLDSLKTVDPNFLKDTKINGYLSLDGLTTVDPNFLKDTKINGYLYLGSLKTVDPSFLKGTTINGTLYLNSLTIVDPSFLKDTTINGWLCLDSLTTVDHSFLKNTKINGLLCLDRLTTVDRDILRNNVKKLEKGYYEKEKYCFFDGILSEVLKVSVKKDYTIYTTPFGFIAQKNNYTAHGETIKKAITDLEFKIISEKLKNEPITEETLFTVKYYRTLTGACETGCRNWIKNNDIPYEIVDDYVEVLTPIKAIDLLPLLEKSNAYGLDKFKSLLTF